MKNALFIVAATIFLASCGSKYQEGNVTGKYGGADWEAATITAKKTKNLTGNDILQFTMYNNDQGAEPCAGSVEADKFSTTCPIEVGEHEFGLFNARFGTFYVDNTNILSNEGAIEVIEITDTEVKARVWCEHDENNGVNGTFTAILCE